MREKEGRDRGQRVKKPLHDDDTDSVLGFKSMAAEQLLSILVHSLRVLEIRVVIEEGDFGSRLSKPFYSFSTSSSLLTSMHIIRLSHSVTPQDEM